MLFVGWMDAAAAAVAGGSVMRADVGCVCMSMLYVHIYVLWAHFLAGPTARGV
jgi:hypothetical protein